MIAHLLHCQATSARKGGRPMFNRVTASADIGRFAPAEFTLTLVSQYPRRPSLP
jgi:hypothetical protein